MALIAFGVATCRLCDELVAEEEYPDELIVFRAFIPSYSGVPARAQFAAFSDSCMHRRCFLAWDERAAFVEYINDAIGTGDRLTVEGRWEKGPARRSR